MQILVDTNVLIYAAKNGFDLFNELKKFGASKILIPIKVITELEQLAKGSAKGSDKKSAKLAIQIINYSDVIKIEIGDGHTDNSIISYSKTNKNLVITNDSELKKRLTANKITVLSLSRNKKIITS
jgi:rRNA-processing protein FCF1